MLLVTQNVLLCLISLTCFLYTLGLTFLLMQNIKIVNLLKCLDWAIFSYTDNMHTFTWHAASVDVWFHLIWGKSLVMCYTLSPNFPVPN